MATYTNYQTNPNYKLNGSHNSSGESVMFGAYPQANYNGFSSSSLNPAGAGSGSADPAPAPTQTSYGYAPSSSISFDVYGAPPSTNTAMVPSYGPPPPAASAPYDYSRQQQQAPPQTVEQRQVVEMDRELDDIIKAQSQALEQARARTVSNNSNTAEPVMDHPTDSSNAGVLHVPRSTLKSGSDAVLPGKKKMRKSRKLHTVAGGATGAICGTLILGPVGTVLGGAAGAYGSNKLHKSSERKAQRKFEQRSVQQGALKAKGIQSASFC